MLISIREILPALEAGRLYRGKGGEQVRAAVCRLVECISVASVPLNIKPSEAQSSYLQSIRE
jgi:hypothetical protein